MNTWLRLYIEILDDPKIQRLEPALFRHWINLLCVAAKNDGFLPSLRDVSFALRLSETEIAVILESLTEKGLLDMKRGAYRPHNWDNRQYKSDSSTERVRRFRKQQRNVSETAEVTHQTRTDTEQNRTDTEKKGKGTGETTRRTRVPAKLEITEEMRLWAQGWKIAVNIDAETAHMLDHFRGKGEMRLDWIATWRTWMRNAKKFAGKNGSNHASGEVIADELPAAHEDLHLHRCSICDPPHMWQHHDPLCCITHDVICDEAIKARQA